MRSGGFFSLVLAACLIAGVTSYILVPRLETASGVQATAEIQQPSAPRTIAVQEPQPGYARAAMLGRESDGHYWARADVDGTFVRFLVDTGASTVALTYRDAQRLGLDPANLDYKWSIQTAGGETKGASVLLSSIRIGNVEVTNVEAMVMREELTQSLLGMTFLGKLYSYEFRQKSLVIRQ